VAGEVTEAVWPLPSAPAHCNCADCPVDQESIKKPVSHQAVVCYSDDVSAAGGCALPLTERP